MSCWVSAAWFVHLRRLYVSHSIRVLLQHSCGLLWQLGWTTATQYWPSYNRQVAKSDEFSCSIVLLEHRTHGSVLVACHNWYMLSVMLSVASCHWHDIITHKLATFTYRSSHGIAPVYTVMIDICTSVAGQVDNISGLLDNRDWLCRDIDATPSPVGLSLLRRHIPDSLHDFDYSFDTFKRHLKASCLSRW